MENIMMLVLYVTLVNDVCTFVCYSPARLQKPIAKMEKYVWLMEMPQQEEWKFVSVVYGEQCVTILGIVGMLELSASNSDLWMNVSSAQKVHIVFYSPFPTQLQQYSVMPGLDWEKDRYIWIIYNALEMKSHY